MSASPITLLPAGASVPISIISVRLFHFNLGAWIAECEVDSANIPPPPTSGKAALALAGSTLQGTIDSRGSGSFLSKASIRLVGGGNGWDLPVPGQDFHSDTGVLSTTVYQATASLIGETVNDLAPQVFPNIDFVRSFGPASRVFGVNPYWLDLAGVTNVGPRPPSIAPKTFLVTDYHPTKSLIEFGSDEIVFPNTPLVDPRFNGSTPITQDIEQLFTAQGGHGWAWVGPNPATRLLNAFQNLVAEASARQYLRGYRYRVAILQGDRYALQAVNPNGAVPDIVPLTPFTGVAGLQATLTPGTIVFVQFDHTTEPPQPIGVSFDNTTPTSLKTTCPDIELGPLPLPLTPGPYSAALLSALETFLTALNPPGPPLTTAQIQTAAIAFTGALASMASGGLLPTTVNLKGC